MRVAGRYLTRALFFEESKKNPDHVTEANPPKFTLRDDQPGLVSFRKSFVSLNDPTGYKWAETYLDDGWAHWQVLIKCTWFEEAYQEAVRELEIKLKSEAISRLRDIAAGQSTQATAAAKYLATLDYKKTSGARGRPSKEEMVGELKRQARLLEDTDNDAIRIGLHIASTRTPT